MFRKNCIESERFHGSFKHQCSKILLKCKAKVFSNIIWSDLEQTKYHRNSKTIQVINSSKPGDFHFAGYRMALIVNPVEGAVQAQGQSGWGQWHWWFNYAGWSHYNQSYTRDVDHSKPAKRAGPAEFLWYDVHLSAVQVADESRIVLQDTGNLKLFYCIILSYWFLVYTCRNC